MADAFEAAALYAGVVPTPLTSIWEEPRAPDPPLRVWRDWVLVAVMVAVSVGEVLGRDDVRNPRLALALSLVAGVLLLWRRTHPLLVLVIGFGAVGVVDVFAIVTDTPPVGLYSTGALAILPYSLFRWASGREISYGLVVIAVVLVLGNAADFQDWGEVFGGTLVILFPAALGATMRFRASARLKEFDQIRLYEREQLARDLHDTVAHHVSAIAIQAQAGRALAASDPQAATEALRIVEEEASRTLAEMRAMVGVLRMSESGELAPQSGIGDIALIGDLLGGILKIDVEMEGDLTGLGPATEAAIYRLAQESITNATRHARNATRVSVAISGGPDSVNLVVEDDGYPLSGLKPSPGFGITGMGERAKLLGGKFEAGPGPKRGWVVRAELPRQGGAS